MFYLHSNLLFQQFSHDYIGFLGLVKMASGCMAIPCRAASPLQRREIQAIKSRRKKQQHKQTRNKTRRPGTVHYSRASIFLCLDTEVTEYMLNETLFRFIIHSAWLIIASANIVFPLVDIRKWHKGERACCSVLKEKEVLGGNHMNT